MANLIPRAVMPLLAGLVAVLALLVLPAQSSAYKTFGTKWPGGKLTYYNGIRAYDPAVKAAVRAWNNSGAKVKLMRVSKKNARVKIRYMPNSTCRGLARLPRAKRTTNATIYLPRPTAPAACRDEFTMTIIAAHEFGHVLGLDHENRRCAVMNPSGNRAGGALCAEAGGTPPWLWRCRILEPDEVRGAIRIYGGTYKASKFKSSPLCQIYGDPPPAGIFSADDSGEENNIVVQLQRGPDGVVPPFLLKQFAGGTPSVYVGYQRDACPAISTATLYSWDSTTPGQLTDPAPIALGVTPGSYCVSVWATDAIGKPSTPTVRWVSITP